MKYLFKDRSNRSISIETIKKAFSVFDGSIGLTRNFGYENYILILGNISMVRDSDFEEYDDNNILNLFDNPNRLSTDRRYLRHYNTVKNGLSPYLLFPSSKEEIEIHLFGDVSKCLNHWMSKEILNDYTINRFGSAYNENGKPSLCLSYFLNDDKRLKDMVCSSIEKERHRKISNPNSWESITSRWAKNYYSSHSTETKISSDESDFFCIGCSNRISTYYSFLLSGINIKTDTPCCIWTTTSCLKAIKEAYENSSGYDSIEQWMYYNDLRIKTIKNEKNSNNFSTKVVVKSSPTKYNNLHGSCMIMNHRFVMCDSLMQDLRNINKYDGNLLDGYRCEKLSCPIDVVNASPDGITFRKAFDKNIYKKFVFRDSICGNKYEISDINYRFESLEL